MAFDRFWGYTPIFVAGYPKSGTTWVTRLIADVLDSPSAGSFPTHDEKEPAAEGWSRDGRYVVRKGHYDLVQGWEGDMVSAHRLNVDTRAPVVFVYRDPRAIAVSMAYYQNITIDQALEKMMKPAFGLPSWADYMIKWERWKKAIGVGYEDLVQNTVEQTRILMNRLDVPYDAGNMIEAIQRQEFNTRRNEIRTGQKVRGGRALNLLLMRDGTWDGWRHDWNERFEDIAQKEWGELWISNFPYIA